MVLSVIDLSESPLSLFDVATVDFQSGIDTFGGIQHATAFCFNYSFVMLCPKICPLVRIFVLLIK